MLFNFLDIHEYEIVKGPVKWNWNVIKELAELNLHLLPFIILGSFCNQL